MSATVLSNLLRHEPRDVATLRRTAEARAALARAVAMAAHPVPLGWHAEVELDDDHNVHPLRSDRAERRERNER